MSVIIKNQKLSISELLSGKIQENILSSSASAALKFVTNWENGQASFPIHSSGSTGKPKEITLSREKIIYSAKSSMAFLDPNNQFKSALLCINPQYVGGMMVLVRALLHDLDLTVIDPATDISDSINIFHYDLVSMVPMQVQHLLKTDPGLLVHFDTVLIGGAPLSNEDSAQLRNLNVRCFHTYGMTETASHVALKNLSNGESFFRTLGDVAIATDDRGCLKLKGTITDHNWIQTNDVVKVIAHDKFEWLGRADFVINSGGVKIHPEIVESLLSPQINVPFFISGIPDEHLGEKAVLFIETDQVPMINFEALPAYHKPRTIITVDQFEYTESGKINRKATLKKIKL